MTTEPISDERLAEIRAGLEGVTPGPWRAVPTAEGMCDMRVTAPNPLSRSGRRTVALIAPTKHDEVAHHIARLDPQTVAALLSRLDKAEESVEIMTALTRTPLYSYRALAERLSQIMGARFGARFMDPPDGGDVPIHEQVERMADALLAAEAPSES